MKPLTLVLALCAFATFGCASVPRAQLEAALAQAPATLAQATAVVATPEAGPRHRPAQIGTASFYHAALVGLPTASGEPYSDQALTAAHRTLDLGTRVRVTNLENSRSVVVTVNDRGPFVRGRVIDLSRRAARALGFVHDGLAKVKVEPLT